MITVQCFNAACWTTGRACVWKHSTSTVSESLLLRYELPQENWPVKQLGDFLAD